MYLRKTFRSSKNRRKHERKLLSLKEGNPFEDIALIDAIYNLVTKIFGYQNHIRDVCKSLLEISKDHEARVVQLLYKQILNLVNDSLNDIWIEEMQCVRPLQNAINVDLTQIQKEQRFAMLGMLNNLIVYYFFIKNVFFLFQILLRDLSQLLH